MLARIASATRPTIHLCEVVSEQQMERLLLLLVGTEFNRGDISWGGAWAQYSLTCMLQDILTGVADIHVLRCDICDGGDAWRTAPSWPSASFSTSTVTEAACPPRGTVVLSLFGWDGGGGGGAGGLLCLSSC